MIYHVNPTRRVTADELSTLEGLVTGTEHLVTMLETSLGWHKGPPLRQRLGAMRRELERLVDEVQMELLYQHAERKRAASTAGRRDRWAARRNIRPVRSDMPRVHPPLEQPCAGVAYREQAVSA